MVDRLNPLLVALIPLGFLLMIAYTIGKMYGKARVDGVRITLNNSAKYTPNG